MQPLKNPGWYATKEDLSDLRLQLSEAHQDLAKAVQAYPPSLWYEPGPNSSWSASQITEHVFLAQRGLRESVRSHLSDAPRGEVVPLMIQRRAVLQQILPNEGKASAGKASTHFSGLALDQVADEIYSANLFFVELLEVAERCPVHAVVWGRGFFGELSAYLWMLYIPLHTVRHVGQLERLRTRQKLENFEV